MNNHFAYRTVRSESVPLETIAGYVEAFDNKYMSLKHHCVFTTDYHGYHIANGRLPDPRVFAMDSASVSLRFQCLDEPLDGLRNFTREIDPDIWQSWFSWDGFEAEHPISGFADEAKFPDEGDVTIEAGWMHFKFPLTSSMETVKSFGCGISVGRRSPGMKDKRYRCDLFNRAFELMGLKDIVYARMKDDEFYVSAEAPYRIYVFVGHPSGLNASAIDVCGITEFDFAWQAAMNVQQHMLKRVKPAYYTVRLSTGSYAKHYQTLNSLADRWEPTIWGRLAKPYLELVADALRDPALPQRIPTYYWAEYRRRKFWGERYQLDVVNLPSGLCLELHSDYSDEKTILARASAVPKLHFELVR